jgi:hypothetical protein
MQGNMPPKVFANTVHELSDGLVHVHSYQRKSLDPYRGRVIALDVGKSIDQERYDAHVEGCTRDASATGVKDGLKRQLFKSTKMNGGNNLELVGNAGRLRCP